MAYYGQNQYGAPNSEGAWGAPNHPINNMAVNTGPTGQGYHQQQPNYQQPQFSGYDRQQFQQQPPPLPPQHQQQSSQAYSTGYDQAQYQAQYPTNSNTMAMQHNTYQPPNTTYAGYSQNTYPSTVAGQPESSAPPPPPPAAPAPAAPRTRYCDTCEKTFHDDPEFKKHLQSSSHYDRVLKKIQVPGKEKSKSRRSREREPLSEERERSESKPRSKPSKVAREHVEKGLAYDPEISAGKCTICPKMDGAYDRDAWEAHTCSKKHRRMLIPYLIFLGYDGFSYQYGSHLIPPDGRYEDTELENLIAGKKSETMSSVPRYLTPKQKARWGVYLLKIARQYNLKCMICGNSSSTYATFYAHVVGKKHAVEVISKLAVMGSLTYRQRYGHLPGPNTVHLGEEEVEMIPDSILPGEQEFVDVDHPPRGKESDETREMAQLDEVPRRSRSPIPSRSGLPLIDNSPDARRKLEEMLQGKTGGNMLTDLLSTLVKQIQDSTTTKQDSSHKSRHKERSRKHHDDDDMELSSEDERSPRTSRHSRHDKDERVRRKDTDYRRSHERGSSERGSSRPKDKDERRSHKTSRLPWDSDSGDAKSPEKPRDQLVEKKHDQVRPPTPPPEPKLEDRLYSTSRFLGMSTATNVELVVVPDGSLNDLVAKAIECGLPHRAYFLFGEAEMVRREQKTDYTEMVMDGHPNRVVEKIVVKMREAIATLSKYNIQAIFSDIVPVSFHNWNFRFSPFQGRPYDAMQQEYNQAIVAINEIILAVNSRRKLHGPMLAPFLLKKVDGKLVLNENKLHDGTTPVPAIRRIWGSYISRVISVNRLTASGGKPFDAADGGPPEYMITEVNKTEGAAPVGVQQMEVEPPYPNRVQQREVESAYQNRVQQIEPVPPYQDNDQNGVKRKQEDAPAYVREMKQQRMDDDSAAQWWSTEFPQQAEAELTGEWVGGFADDGEERLPHRLINDLMPLHDYRYESGGDSPHLLDRIYGTDRVNGLNIPAAINVESIPGAKLEALVEKALDFGQPHTAYFICGIPDLTHAPLDKLGYREVTVPRMTIGELTNIYISLMRSMSAKLWQYDIRPVFTPPVAMDISSFNAFLLEEGVTKEQYHTRNYKPMQAMLNKVVYNLAEKVREINQENQVYTPCLESIVMKFDSKNPAVVQFLFDELVDGLHLTERAKMAWSVILRRSLIVNRRILLGAPSTAYVDIWGQPGEYIFGSSIMPALDERYGMPENMHPLVTRELAANLLNHEDLTACSSLMAIINNLDPELFRVVIQPNVQVLISRLQKIVTALRDPDADHVAASQDLEAIVAQPHFVHPPVQTLLWKLGFAQFFRKLVPEHPRLTIMREFAFPYEVPQIPGPICHLCKQPGHLSRSCPSLPKTCYRCHEPGHRARDCPEFTNNKNKKKCFVCNKAGHIAADCRDKKTCINCKKVGHIYDDCPERQKKDKKGSKEKCSKCNLVGHNKEDCPKKKSEQKNDAKKTEKTSEKKCDTCKKSGHVTSNCPEKKEKATPEKKCKKCQKSGHIEADCPVKKEQATPEKICFNCQKVGHIKADCPKDKVQHTTGKRCDECGEIGHLKRNCPSRYEAADSHNAPKSDKYKTVRCWHWPDCPKGSSCSFLHPNDKTNKRCGFWPGNCRKGDACEYLHETNKRCGFWPGNCRKGDACEYLHEQPMPKPPPRPKDICRFWGSPQGCKNGDRCTFFHDAPAKPAGKPCKFWPGDCYRGADCPWPHPGFY